MIYLDLRRAGKCQEPPSRTSEPHAVLKNACRQSHPFIQTLKQITSIYFRQLGGLEGDPPLYIDVTTYTHELIDGLDERDG